MSSISYADMPLLVQAGMIGVIAVAFLAFLLVVALRFMRRGAARFWAASGGVALVLFPAVLGAGIGSLSFQQALGGLALTGSGGVSALAAASVEALLPLFVGLAALAPLAFVGLLLTAFGSSRVREGSSGGAVALPALALVVVFLSAGLVALLVWNVASVNAGERDGSSLLVRTNLAVGGSALLAVLLLVLVLVTAVGAPRGASPVIVKLAALAAFALCGLLAVAGAWVVYSNVESYVATAVTGSSPDALPPPVGADLAEPPPAPAPPPPPPASLRSVRPSGGRSPAEGRSSGGTAAIRVGGEIKEPRKIRNVPPVYPQIAKEARVQGVVILEATIGREGNVTDVKVLRAIPLLDQAAIDAVRQWVYAPTLLNGEPVPVIMTVTVNFKLSSQ